MQSEPNPEGQNSTGSVQIPQAASRGGAALLLLSAAVLLLALVSIIGMKQLAGWQAVLLLMAGLGIYAGWAKLAEPQYFLHYDANGVSYLHRHGSWHLPWHSFLYSGVPQLNQQSLAYIGFRLTDYDGFLQPLPLRLAVRLMTEQRELYLAAIRQGCSTGQCAGELLAEGSYFTTSKQQYNGVKAAFGWRMQQLNRQTGFDVFVPVSLTETEAAELCRQINQARLQLIQNTVT
ncbi:DUF2982 domain-containing protein [Rheinheimera nanhaiensis]|uniref:DUF2982 domain-containing protein n=1 Tax=Rheinheimera nanhaiensis E407-8 TaxID=562729 RepID=I1DVP4_9GAMM|nr:DUF2982 domain-containing protein [Rheinheimera nanhaiensis]GAB58122.1 hypothetical protein RNAN_1093 [Rheinheimera nanhaiensis E407-8]